MEPHHIEPQQTADQMEQLNSHVSKLEEESAKLHEMQDEMMVDVENSISITNEGGENGANGANGEDGEAPEDGENKHLSIQERQEIDNRSIYVGNIDYAATPEELQELFKECGTINRITILTNKMTGVPLGYGFVEFEIAESIPKALQHDQALFKGRPLKVTQKRTNVPGFGRGRGGFRGGIRGGRGGFQRGGFQRGGFQRGGFRGGRGGFQRGGRGGFPRGGGRGGFPRGGGRGGFTPY